MDGQELAVTLTERFNSAQAAQFDGAFCIDTGTAQIAFTVSHGELATAPADADVDLTLYFHSAQEALELLTGNGDVIQAFMDGRFRSDGYLIWVFTLLAMFR